MLAYEPMRALSDEESSKGDQDSRYDDGRIHPTPRLKVRILKEDHKSDEGSNQSSDCLESERCQDQSSSRRGRNALGNDHVCGWVVAAERETGPKEA